MKHPQGWDIADALREALKAAASSLRALSNAGLMDQPLLDSMQNVRGYANSRANVADAALAAPRGEPAKRWRCEHCGETWSYAVGQRMHAVDAESEYDEGYWCGPVVEEKKP